LELLITNKGNISCRVGNSSNAAWSLIKSARLRPAGLIAPPGILDDFDVCVSLRFLAGDTDNYFAGFDLRASDDGSCQVGIDSGGRFYVSWYDKRVWGGYLVKWGFQPALHKGFEARNTLCVLMHGPQMRVYLNGVFSVSLHDARFSVGQLHLLAGPYNQEMRLAVSNLQVREARVT
jgi:hypothetical protein